MKRTLLAAIAPPIHPPAATAEWAMLHALDHCGGRPPIAATVSRHRTRPWRCGLSPTAAMATVAESLEVHGCLATRTQAAQTSFTLARSTLKPGVNVLYLTSPVAQAAHALGMEGVLLATFVKRVKP